MAYKKVKKAKVDKEAFKRVLAAEGWSIRRLCKALECDEDIDPALHRSDRAVRDSLNRGEMRADVLDALGRVADIDPGYLSGEAFRRVMATSLPGEVKRAIVASMLSKRHPYGVDDPAAEERYLEDILSLHGVSRARYAELDEEARLQFALAVEEALAPVVMKTFYMDCPVDEAYENVYALSARIEGALDSLREEEAGVGLSDDPGIYC